jgi:isocitrate dehydrogenase
MTKITYSTPIVEMQGDEMTRVLWDAIKEKLIEPFVDLNVDYYDLGLVNREKTSDKVTVDAANAIKKYRVGVKCATITPNAQRVEEYNLSKMWLSPNGTIRAILDGTVFRKPVVVKGIKPFVGGWLAPITVARHAYGDVYRNSELRVDAPAEAFITVKYADGRTEEKKIADFKAPGVVQGIHNLDASIESFCRACFNYALAEKQDLWFATKDTISKIYDHRFKDIFADIFASEYADKFAAAGITYSYTLIDDAVARVIRSNGGMTLALKNYDGDVLSDMIASGFGSLAMMTSVLVSPDGNFEYEAAHGTVTRHYYKYRAGEKTSTNPVATIFAWTGALRKRGELDDNAQLVAFADRLETATKKTIESGVMTKDLIPLFDLDGVVKRECESMEFLDEIRKTLDKISK